MVYGWTRDDFLKAVTTKNNLEEPTERDLIVSNGNIAHDVIDVSYTVSNRKTSTLNSRSSSSGHGHHRRSIDVEALLDQQETELSDLEELDTSNEYSIHKV